MVLTLGVGGPGGELGGELGGGPGGELGEQLVCPFDPGAALLPRTVDQTELWNAAPLVPTDPGLE